MSDNVEKILQDAVNDVIKDAVNICNDAVDNVSHMVANKMETMARRLLSAYYSSYAPIRYKRTYQLKNSMSKFSNMKRSSTHITAQIGMEYNPDAMSYHSHEYDEGRPIDSSWVFNQFFAGIHPNARSDRFRGKSPDHELYMLRYVDILGRHMSSYINNEIISMINTRLMK